MRVAIVLASLEINIFSGRTLSPATSSVCHTKFSNIMFQLSALEISDIFHILYRLTVNTLGFHDTIHWKRPKQVNLRFKATRLAGTTYGAEEVFIVHSSPASYYTGKNCRELGKYEQNSTNSLSSSFDRSICELTKLSCELSLLNSHQLLSSFDRALRMHIKRIIAFNIFLLKAIKKEQLHKIVEVN